MCYILSVTEMVGIRELRQNLSRYLRRVVAGERLVVTERRRPVAVLAPWVDEADPLERLIGQGHATRGRGDLVGIEPVARPLSDAGTRALEEERGERLG
jgi:prevent-host-death family protein